MINKYKKIVGLFIISFLFLLPNTMLILANSSPTISIVKGNPSSKVDPPYTFTFRVTDSSGISSIVVNGRELSPGGIDSYDVDWTTYYNNTFVITAENSNGGKSSKSLKITNIATAMQKTEAPTTRAVATEAPTTRAAAKTEAPTTRAAATEAPTTRAAATEAPTTRAAATEAPTTRAAATEAPTTRATATEAPATETLTTSSTIKETKNVNSDEVAEASKSLEGQTEPDSSNENSLEKEKEAEKGEVKTNPELPPDSYRLYEGKKNYLVTEILVICCIFIMLYYIITLILDKKRLKLYQKLYDLLIEKKKSKRDKKE